MRRVATVLMLVLAASGAASRPARAVDDVRPGDAIVRDLEAERKVARRPLPEGEFLRVHARIAALVAELRATAPDDSRLPGLLPERWSSLNYAGRREEAEVEIRSTLASSRDPVLRRTALYYQICLLELAPTGEADRLAAAEEFAREAPGDNRGAELFSTPSSATPKGSGRSASGWMPPSGSSRWRSWPR